MYDDEFDWSATPKKESNMKPLAWIIVTAVVIAAVYAATNCTWMTALGATFAYCK